MLKQNLVGAAIATCLTHRALHDKLFDVLANGTDITAKGKAPAFHGECQEILRAALECEEPRRFRVNDIEQVVRAMWPTDMFHGTQGNTIPFMDTLAARMLIETPTGVHFDADALDDYTRLAARIDPALLLSWKILSDVDPAAADAQARVATLVEATRPFCAPAPSTHAPVYADNHVHQGGAACEQLVLMQALQGGKIGSAGKANPITIKLGVVQELAHALLSSDDSLEDGARFETDCIWLLSTEAYVRPWPLVDWELMRDATGSVAPFDTQWFKHKLATAICKEELATAWLWFLLWCVRQYRDSECAPKRRIAIFVMLGTIMRIRRDMFVEGYGLRRFNEAGGNRAGDGLTLQLQADAARRMLAGADDVAEIKVKINALKENAVRNWADRVARVSYPGAVVSEAQVVQSCARWHYCVLFSRDSKDPWTLADNIAEVLRSDNGWTEIGRDLPGNPSGHTLYPARLIRSLDVAGDENESKIEVFAPALRWLRGLARPASDPAPLRLSVHAGEDFAHPVSGMRHIDETVRFCAMRNGDRIGHGIALGIPPAQWFEEHSPAMLTVHEYFDNLVWAWHYSQRAPHLPGAKEVARAYAQAARRLASAVRWLQYPTPWNGMPDMATLHQAWMLRANCARTFNKRTVDESKRRDAVPDWVPHEDRAHEPEHVNLFRQRISWADKIGKYDAYVRQEKGIDYRVQLSYSPRNTAFRLRQHDTHRLFTVESTPLEMTFLEALQDFLIEEYSQLGLVFEVNPTSNRHIGPFGELRVHPVFRWHPPDPRQLAHGPAGFNCFGLRTRPLPVCINTDDPGIMPTTLRTEFDLLRHAALERGYPSQEVEMWLHRLRMKGRAIFVAAHPKPVAIVPPRFMASP